MSFSSRRGYELVATVYNWSLLLTKIQRREEIEPELVTMCSSPLRDEEWMVMGTHTRLCRKA